MQLAILLDEEYYPKLRVFDVSLIHKEMIGTYKLRGIDNVSKRYWRAGITQLTILSQMHGSIERGDQAIGDVR